VHAFSSNKFCKGKKEYDLLKREGENHMLWGKAREQTISKFPYQDFSRIRHIK